MFVHHLIRRLQSLILARPGRVLIATVVVVLVSVYLGLGVEFRTSRTELAPPDDPEQVRLTGLLKEFRGAQALVVCVEAAAEQAPGPADLRAFTDRVADRLQDVPEVGHVFHRVDLPWLLDRGLYLVPPESLDRGLEFVREQHDLLGALSAGFGLADLNHLLADRIEHGFSDPEARGAAGAQGVNRLTDLLRAQRRLLEDPESILDGEPRVPIMHALARAAGTDPGDGYLATRDGRTLFVFVIPAEAGGDLATHRRLVTAVRTETVRLAGSDPRFRTALTGTPARVVEEMASVSRDTWKTSTIAMLGVTVLTLLVFRWKTHAFLVLVALAVGVVTAFGAVRLELGYLNLITSAFISTLIGVGVAYGIHPVSEYELEGAHTVNATTAVQGAYHRTGAAVTTAAITTSLAFFSILLMDFRGFAELGLVAGVGVLLCLTAALVVLPALLVVYGHRRARRDRVSRGAAATSVDRLWVERGAAWVCRFPRTTTVVALVVTLAAGRGALDIEFDTNILELLPRGSESVDYQRRMLLESEMSPVFNIVVAEDLDRLRELRRRAQDEPTIREFQSVLRFLPVEPEASGRAVGEVAGLLQGLDLAGRPRPTLRSDLGAALSRLEGVVADAADAAFASGLGEVAAGLEGALQEVEATQAVIGRAPDGAEHGWDRALERTWEWFGESISDLGRAARFPPPTLDTLPDDLRSRFVTENGRLLGFLLPEGEVFDREFLSRYVAASRRVSPEATGFPAVFHHMTTRITTGFYRAVLVGVVLVLVVLLVDYRNLRRALQALVPLALGVIWMLGGMRVLGLSFNFANLVGVPLILGVGIDNGVHVVHRLQLEGEAGMAVVLRHTGRAILISSLTTMIGFGSLALASHRGLASLGVVLLLGVGSCLVTSMVVLPNLLVVTGAVRR